ncbi:plasma-membrane choline transporter-domain-containing protein [Zopfochytrium polystomum]|nr:plasma-membrane choline transporter-domain-containing protein [Zopfochytrium polystomum]
MAFRGEERKPLLQPHYPFSRQDQERGQQRQQQWQEPEVSRASSLLPYPNRPLQQQHDPRLLFFANAAPSAEEGALETDSDHDGPAVSPVAAPTSAPIFKQPGERRPKDTVFSFLYFVCFVGMVLTAVTTLLRADHDMGGDVGRDLRRRVYETLKDSLWVIVGTAAASILAGTAWVMFMSAFAKPIIWGTVIAIPILCLGAFAVILTDAILGKAEDPPFLDTQYNIMIGFALSFLFGGFGSGGFFFTKRKQIRQSVNIIEMSCKILWENPSVFVLSLSLMAVYFIFSTIWIIVFSHVFLVPSLSTELSPLSASSLGALVFFVVMHFWTSSILHNVEKVAIAGVVGQWYFKRNDDETYQEDQTWRYLKVALTTSFGSISLSSLIMAAVQTAQYFLQRLQKKNSTEYRQSLLSLVDACMDCAGRSIETVSTFTLSYCGLTGESFFRSAYLSTRIFRRNLVVGITSMTLTRTILFLGALVPAGSCGAGGFFFAARGLASPYAYIVGALGGAIPFYVLRFMSQVVQNTIDAAFICYMMDLDTNTNNCHSAHAIFEPTMRLAASSS